MKEVVWKKRIKNKQEVFENINKYEILLFSLLVLKKDFSELNAKLYTTKIREMNEYVEYFICKILNNEKCTSNKLILHNRDDYEKFVKVIKDNYDKDNHSYDSKKVYEDIKKYKKQIIQKLERYIELKDLNIADNYHTVGTWFIVGMILALFSLVCLNVFHINILNPIIIFLSIESALLGIMSFMMGNVFKRGSKVFFLNRKRVNIELYVEELEKLLSEKLEKKLGRIDDPYLEMEPIEISQTEYDVKNDFLEKCAKHGYIDELYCVNEKYKIKLIKYLASKYKEKKSYNWKLVARVLDFGTPIKNFSDYVKKAPCKTEKGYQAEQEFIKNLEEEEKK